MHPKRARRRRHCSNKSSLVRDGARRMAAARLAGETRAVTAGAARASPLVPVDTASVLGSQMVLCTVCVSQHATTLPSPAKLSAGGLHTMHAMGGARLATALPMGLGRWSETCLAMRACQRVSQASASVLVAPVE
jgi:hypothetical protein